MSGKFMVQAVTSNTRCRIGLLLFAAGLCSCATPEVSVGWGQPTLLAPDPKDSGESVSPVAIDDEGRAVAVWVEARGRKALFANTYSPLEGWGQAVPIDGERDDASDPRLAMNAAGAATVFWTRSNGTVARLYRNSYRPAAGWSTAVEVEASAGVPASRALTDRSANLLVLWTPREQDGLRARLVDAVTGVSSDLAVPAAPHQALGLQFAAHSSGDFTVVWYQLDPTDHGTEYHIWSMRYRRDSGLGDREMILEAGTDAIDPRLAVSGHGDVMVVWRQFDGQHYSLVAAQHRSDGGWQTPVTLETHDEEAVYPNLVVDDSGNAIVVWVQRRCDASRRCDVSHVWANRFDATTGWGQATRIAEHAGDAHVAMDRLGNALVVGTGPGWGLKRFAIWARHYRVRNGWGEPMRVETNLGNTAHPQIAMNARGQAVVSWEQYRLGHRTIWANLYRP